MAIGLMDRQPRFDDAALLLGEELMSDSVYRLLAEHGDRLFGDEYFADLIARSRLGRPTVAARVVATVMLLQSHEGLRASDRPRRLLEDVNATARAAGLLRGRRRVLDSTPLLDAVATQDTVTQLRAAIRKLLTVAEQAGELELAAAVRAVRAVLTRDDEYATVGKPPCDWDDRAARDGLVDALVRDANAALAVLHGRG